MFHGILPTDCVNPSPTPLLFTYSMYFEQFDELILICAEIAKMRTVCKTLTFSRSDLCICAY